MDNTEKKPKGAGKSSFELIDSDKFKSALPIKSGSIVIDLACGKGIYSMFLSKIVGGTGLIYAVDLWKEGLLLLEEQIEKKSITNIKTLLNDAGKKIEIGIDDHSTDICLMATVLHDFEEAGQADIVLKDIKTLLKPGGCLAVVEFKKIEGPPGPPIHIRLSEAEVEKMVTRHGFVKKETIDIGEYNYLMTFLST
jgi:ubiquinone/menaquinone biosynthesis C-methylase UbiE